MHLQACKEIGPDRHACCRESTSYTKEMNFKQDHIVLGTWEDVECSV